MRWHRATAGLAALTLLASGGALSGCDSNVGVAARVDGATISETTVSDYVTAQAKSLTLPQPDGSNETVAPRPFVLSVLIRLPLYAAILQRTPGGAPSDRKLDQLVSTALNGQSADSVATRLGVRGYTTAFDERLIRLQELGALLSKDAQAGVNVQGIATRLRFPVSVNPRYGRWDAASFNLSAAATAGLPGYLDLKSGSAS